MGKDGGDMGRGTDEATVETARTSSLGLVFRGHLYPARGSSSFMFLVPIRIKHYKHVLQTR